MEKFSELGTQPIFGAIGEAKRIGKAAKDIVYEDVLDLLPRPLDEVREMLNIEMPKKYHETHDMMRNVGIDPYELIGAKAA